MPGKLVPGANTACIPDLVVLEILWFWYIQSSNLSSLAGDCLFDLL